MNLRREQVKYRQNAVVLSEGFNEAPLAYSDCPSDFDEISSQFDQAAPGKLVVILKRGNFVALRLARFFIILSPNSFGLPLLSILSTLGCLLVRIPLSPSRTSPQHSNEVLLCAFCQLSLPLSDIFKHNALSEIQYTAQLLEKLSVLHAAECEGRFGAKLLRQDDVHFSVAEKTSFTSTSSSLPVSRMSFTPYQLYDGWSNDCSCWITVWSLEART